MNLLRPLILVFAAVALLQELPPDAAHTYRLRGRRGATTIRFGYRVPNG